MQHKVVGYYREISTMGPISSVTNCWIAIHLHIHTHHHKYMELFWNITLHGAKHRWIEIGHNP